MHRGGPDGPAPPFSLPLRFLTAGTCTASPEKVAEGRTGEDAMFMRADSCGVGGWAEVGVNSSAYSSALMSHTAAAIGAAAAESGPAAVAELAAAPRALLARVDKLKGRGAPPQPYFEH